MIFLESDYYLGFKVTETPHLVQKRSKIMSDCLLSPDNVNQEHIVDIRLAASKMTGAIRRNFMAEMTLKYCKGSARMAETVFGWSKYTVATGLGEKRTGITCLGAQSAYSGHIRWEEREPEAAEALRLLAESQSQQDPTFRTVITSTRLTAESALNALKEQGFADEHLPSRSSMAMILNRMGYRLRKVVKAKPLKKIKETDAIFDNIQDKDQQAKDNGDVKRVSMDCKATVKIGDFSRGGNTRGDTAANDHDFGWQEKYTPCGILDEDSAQLSINFGNSYKTRDFIVDTLEGWWFGLPVQEQQGVKQIQLKIDNGPESSGVRTQFLSRMVDFSTRIGLPIQLLYYPPYHSKYHPIERCWGVLEMHWNGTKLTDSDTMVGWARSMTWKGVNPVVKITKKMYEKGISLSKAAMRKVEKYLQRNPSLPKWDILINPQIVT